MTNAAELSLSEDRRGLADVLHTLLPGMCEVDEDLDAPPCWTLAVRLLESDWLAARNPMSKLKASLGPDYDVLSIAIPLNVSGEIDADEVAAMAADTARRMIVARLD